MTGTTTDIIPIVIIPIVVLAFWLVMLYHAASHPQWGSHARADELKAFTGTAKVVKRELAATVDQNTSELQEAFKG